VKRRGFMATLLPGAAAAQAVSGNPAPATGARTPYQALLLTPTGPRGAVVGAGLVVVDQLGQPLRLEAVPAMRHQVVQCEAGVFTVPGLLVLFRNGMALAEGVDWERTPTGARLTAQGADVGDVWTVLCP
jgi:hypothetical protein